MMCFVYIRTAMFCGSRHCDVKCRLKQCCDEWIRVELSGALLLCVCGMEETCVYWSNILMCLCGWVHGVLYTVHCTYSAV